ncbi:MAG: DUF1848 domain-containing protein [Oscillospiraceae bacterium]|nr:DUF1848 domain-containing protein [Oscillospiraceae bacterium]
MIISASRRTDIPAFYTDWLVNRIKAGCCVTQNPMNPKQIRRVSLLPNDVLGIVLWTKNAAPLLSKLPVLEPFPYYFQYTITPYDIDIEHGLASKRDVVIPAFLQLASQIGSGRVIWRYDPIVITCKYNVSYHIRAFSRLCGLLSGSTHRCVISYVTDYKSITKNLREIGSEQLEVTEKLRLTQELLRIAKEHGIALCACCESPEIYALGVESAACVDAGLISKISGKDLQIPRDKNQRVGCSCAVSVDIGAYNSCLNGCLYCYANHSETRVQKNYATHDPLGEMLIGQPIK